MKRQLRSLQKQIVVRCEPEQRERLKQESEELGITMQALCERKLFGEKKEEQQFSNFTDQQIY